MFYEYALDPACLSSWDRTRFFLDAFGPWKGRFLAKYPHKWKRMVFESLRCPEVEKQRIVERLRMLDARAFSPRADATYDPDQTWFSNAVSEHHRRPFRAIIASHGSASGSDYVLDGAEVDDRQERWRVETGRLVSREPTAFVQSLRLLLEASERVLFIDPYFRSDQDDKTRPLVAFCKATHGSAAVEVHFSDEPRGYGPCMADAARTLPIILPTGAKVTLHCWRERPGGPRLHNRYVLTEVGGVKFGDGIETGSRGHEDHLSILDEPSRLKLWEQFVGSPPAFEPAGAPQEFVGKGLSTPFFRSESFSRTELSDSPPEINPRRGTL